ncbi:MAG TPA: GNAT family N-acetyltransferase [Microlunatus sp.]
MRDGRARVAVPAAAAGAAGGRHDPGARLEDAAEIDDVQTALQWQRRCVASALLTQALGRIRNRTGLPIRLVTEGHDPAGARSLYESLGFVTVSRHGRYRKPLPTADPD